MGAPQHQLNYPRHMHEPYIHVCTRGRLLGVERLHLLGVECLHLYCARTHSSRRQTPASTSRKSAPNCIAQECTSRSCKSAPTCMRQRHAPPNAQERTYACVPHARVPSLRNAQSTHAGCRKVSRLGLPCFTQLFISSVSFFPHDQEEWE